MIRKNERKIYKIKIKEYINCIKINSLIIEKNIPNNINAPIYINIFNNKFNIIFHYTYNKINFNIICITCKKNMLNWNKNYIKIFKVSIEQKIKFKLIFFKVNKKDL